MSLFLARRGSLLTTEEHAAVQWLLQGHAQGALEWHREKQYKYAVLRHVAEGLYHHAALPPAAALAPGEARDDDDALPGGAKAGGPAPGGPSPPREPSPADSSEQAGGEAPDSAAAAPASAPPAGKRRSLFSPRALKGVAIQRDASPPNKSSAAAEAEQGAEHRPAAPAARAVRRMLIQDAMRLPELAELAEAEISGTVIYLSAHYKKLPATGFHTARRAEAAGAEAAAAEAAAAEAAAAAAAAADPSEYHALKEGGEASPPAPSNLYDEVASRFEELGVKVTSDGEAAYAADRRAIVLLVLSPELFRCAELVDEIARHLDRQAPAEAKGRPRRRP